MECADELRSSSSELTTKRELQALDLVGSGGEAAAAETLLQEADLGLYRAKSQGRGTWCFF